MAQAFEYKVIASPSDAAFISSLATEDAAGWELVGYSSAVNTSGGGAFMWSALLRRRV